MADYIALEDGFHLLLEDNSGSLLLELQGVAVVSVPSVPSAAQFGAPTLTVSAPPFLTVGVPSVPSMAQFGGSKLGQTVRVPGLDPYAGTVFSITGQVIVGDGHLVGWKGGPGPHFGRVTIKTGPVTVAVPSVPSMAQFGSAATGLIVFNVRVRPIICTDTVLAGIVCGDTVLVASAPASVDLQPAGCN